jgi:NADH-quinone oxidoreductase subunit C
MPADEAPVVSRIEMLAAAVESAFGDFVARQPALGDELCYEVLPANLLQVATVLRDAPALKFEMLMDLAGVDYLQFGAAEWKTSSATRSGFSRGVANRGAPQETHEGPRFAIACQLLSITHNHRLRLRVHCDGGDDPTLDSLCDVWACANWFEREAFDLFGILFRGHPDLRRILTDYGFIGHPFRKDFPLIGNVEVRYDAAQGRVIYEPVGIEARTLVPRVIRHDNRYEPALKDPAVVPRAPGV